MKKNKSPEAAKPSESLKKDKIGRAKKTAPTTGCGGEGYFLP